MQKKPSLDNADGRCIIKASCVIQKKQFNMNIKSKKEAATSRVEVAASYNKKWGANRSQPLESYLKLLFNSSII